MSKGYSDVLASRRKSNHSALSAFGVTEEDGPYREIVDGTGPTVFTVGYERRDGDELIAALQDAGVDTLVDVRQRAMSRRVDFRGKALSAACDAVGMNYLAMPELGSTDELRNQLQETGDFSHFARRFRNLAKRTMTDPLNQIAQMAPERSIALICYERCHDECHRSVITEILHEMIDARIVAIQ